MYGKVAYKEASIDECVKLWKWSRSWNGDWQGCWDAGTTGHQLRKAVSTEQNETKKEARCAAGSRAGGEGLRLLDPRCLQPAPNTVYRAAGFSVFPAGFQSCFPCDAPIPPFSMIMFSVGHFIIEVCNLFFNSKKFTVQRMPWVSEEILDFWTDLKLLKGYEDFKSWN